ncbi:MAG: DEAD/DEAH box helicase, partial [bacterium]
MTPFESLGLGPKLLQALKEAGYEQPTPIQAQAIRPIIEGRDLLGIAQTGTGKTAAFALPLLETMSQRGFKNSPGRVRVLVLTPTRELAAQVESNFRTYGRHMPLRSAVIFGGVGQGAQVKALERGLDVLIATPGRLLDLMQQRHAHLGHLEVLVLDEADRMLDMGFIRDVRKITAVLPRERQTLLFSATMPDAIASLSQELLRDPVRVEVTPQATTVERVRQSLMFVDKGRKRDLLRHLLADKSILQALVFARTKRGADRVAEDLEAHGIAAAAIHGNKAQNHRERTLRSFRSGQTRVLVATDIAARGLDIPGVSHVFNFELPDEPESYVHRIGRTARAGREGTAIAFCCSEELEQLRDIEKIIGLTLDVDAEQPYALNIERLPVRGRNQPSAPRSSGGQRSQGGHRHQVRHHREGGGPGPRSGSNSSSGSRSASSSSSGPRSGSSSGPRSNSGTSSG